MGKEKSKKKSPVGFQFNALQNRIKLLNAKITVLSEENRRLKAEALEVWRQSATGSLVEALEKDLFNDPKPGMVGLSEQLPPKKPWWKLF